MFDSVRGDIKELKDESAEFKKSLEYTLYRLFKWNEIG
mgnify:CR=1 FL=1